VIDRSKLAAALLVVGAVLLIAPAVVPVQPVLYHEVQGSVQAEESTLQQRGVEVVEYENLSDRGKTLFEQALRNDGSYVVPLGEGASDFDYRAESDPDSGREDGPPSRYPSGAIAIERPADGDLPGLYDRPARRPADESRPSGADETGGTGTDDTSDDNTTATNGSATDRVDASEQPQRPEQYNVFRARLGQPPLTDGGNLLRFLSVLVGVVMVGIGGYLHSRP